MEPRELLQKFNERYGGYICIDEEIATLYLSSINNPKLATADYLYDWVLANDLAYEVVE